MKCFNRGYKQPLALTLLGLACAQACAQTTIPGTLQDDAQRVQRYYDNRQAPPAPVPVDPLNQPVADAHGNGATPGAGVSFRMTRVTFTPSSLLGKDELDEAVKPFVGTQMDRARLDNMLDAINARYTARKITTARAVLKSQAITDGVVGVELVEGKLDTVKVQGNRHVSDAFVRRRISQQDGQVVDTDRLRDDLIYMNRSSDLQLRALLEPGAARGETNILVAVEEPARTALDVFVDNSGVDSTGRNRVGLSGHVYSLFGTDDALDGNVAHSRGGNDGSVSYSIPVTASNGRLGVNYSHSQINIVSDAFTDIHVAGTSSVASLQYTQPFIATQAWLFSGVGSYSAAQSTTSISGEQIADTHTRSFGVGLILSHQRDGQRWSVTQLLNTIHSDEPLLGKSQFLTAPGNASFIQRFGQTPWAFRADAGWQLSSGTNVPSANLFQIGGAGSVRGYQRGVLGGARGYYLDLELHRGFGEHFDLFVFGDRGQVYATYPNNQDLNAAGVGGNFNYRWFSLSADIGKPFQTVIANQDSTRINFRMTAHF
jgi:hemolysin activation/secretion protein